MATPVTESNSGPSVGKMFAAAVILAAAGGVGTYVVLAPSQSERILATLPPLPSFERKPAALEQRLHAAHAAARESGSIEDLIEYVTLLHANGFAERAAQGWLLLGSVDPSNAQWPYYLAHLRRDEGDIGETARLLGQTVEIAPTYSPAWLQLGDLALKSAKWDLAQSHYEERLHLVAKDPYARIGLARIELQKGDRSAAREALNEIVKDHPQFSSAHNLLARMYREDGDKDLANRHRWEGYRSGRFITAEDPWLRELEAACLTPSMLFVYGMVEFQTGRGDLGRSAYERAVEYEPENPGNHELLGDLYRKLKEPELARASLRRSLELSAASGTSPSLLALIHLGAIEREIGNFASSRAIIAQGIESHPASPELQVELGLSLDALGENEKAGDAFRKAITMSPNDTAANFHLGEWWLRRDETEQAIPHFEQSLALQPTFSPSLRYLLQYTLGTNQLDKAQEYADTLLGAYYGDSEVRQLVAICYLRLGREQLTRNETATAIDRFRTARKLDADDVDIAFELGTLLLAEGSFREALPPLETLLKKRPTDARAHFFLAQAQLMDGRPRAAKSLLEKGLRFAEQSGNRSTAANIREMLQAISR
ncbi:MAG: tetratricopeptide repeat protein [Opitutaceae bacterium]|jgi:tetratricopeptide (TPR) repeat protein|nr:tetratricopeptide repeat protein [Opitutaceae bacterium]